MSSGQLTGEAAEDPSKVRQNVSESHPTEGEEARKVRELGCFHPPWSLVI